MGRTLTKECLESTTSGVFVRKYTLNPNQHFMITRLSVKNCKDPNGLESWARTNAINFDQPKIIGMPNGYSTGLMAY